MIALLWVELKQLMVLQQRIPEIQMVIVLRVLLRLIPAVRLLWRRILGWRIRYIQLDHIRKKLTLDGMEKLRLSVPILMEVATN